MPSQSEMQKRDPVRDVPDDLRNAMEAGQVVPFVGAGVSMGADLGRNRRMPSYKELLMAMFRRAEKNNRFSSKRQRDRCLRLIETGSLMKAADILDNHKVLNQRDLYSYLREELNHLQPKPSLVHELLNLLNFNTILTSNYDRLLESSLFPAPEVVTYRDKTSIPILTREGKPFVFKIHGDLTRPETIVLGWRRYKNLHAIRNRDNIPLQDFIRGLLQHKTLLFLGCSFAGGEYAEYFSDFLETHEVQSKHFALVDASGLTEAEKKTRRDEWYHKGIEILYFTPDESYSQVWEFLAALKPKRAIESIPTPGTPWENFYVLDERPDYLQLQLDREIASRSCRYLTPSLTNALAPESYIHHHCEKELGKFEPFVSDFPTFKARTVEIMLQRAKNLERLLESGRIELRAIFLQDSIEQELNASKGHALERFKYIISLAERLPNALGIRAYPTSMDRGVFMKSTYALVFSDTASPDIAMFYAPQATTNKFKAHIVQINTRPVMERVEHFERLWVASLSEKKTLDLLRSTVTT